ncbi:MAG: hypothetical protein HZB53_09410 [Chloroflexi bacterium]|nr:hypothetical protein [Chloroflexota bacterium]
MSWVIVPGLLALAILLGLTWQTSAAPVAASWPDVPSPIRATGAITMDKFVYLPLIYQSTAACQAIPAETYGTLPAGVVLPLHRPAEVDADINLGWRGYAQYANAQLVFRAIGGDTDPNAPQFPSLFADNRVPTLTSGYQIYDWDWGCNCRQGLHTTNPSITVLGMGSAANEIISVPSSGYNIGNGYGVLILYADTTRITLKYTAEDSVIAGYTLHVENVCTEPRLLQLYRDMNAAGRGQLPALRGGQGFGRAIGQAIIVGIQDNGTWMDPRSCKDWWQGRNLNCQ